MGKQIRSVRTKLTSHALWAALGFGVGGAIGGSLWSFNPDNPMFPLTMSIMGAFGYASLSLALRRNWKKAALLTLVGAVVFTAGSWPVLFTTAMVMTELRIHPGPLILVALALLINGGIQGIAGAVPLLLVTKNRYRGGWLIAAGAIGFAIGVQFILGMVIGLPGAVALALWGIVGGASLGAALGYLENSKVRERS